MVTPVTVSITRHVDPAHADQMLAWIRAGGSLALRFSGFLSTGWVRSGPDSDEWHMLYRFADDESLGRWEHSPQRHWWLGAAQRTRRRVPPGAPDRHRRLVRRALVRRRGPPPAHAGAPRWKQATMIWLVFFPLSLAVTLLLGAVAPDLAAGYRVLGTTLTMTPLMTYVALPWMTRALGWWLAGDPPPWRR